MNRYLLVFFSIFLICLLGISGIIIAEEFKDTIKINEGKELVNFSSEFSPIYVKDLILLNPNITTVTYNNGTHDLGYVDVFGGIGENFVVSPNKIYEITSKGEVTLNLK